MFELLILSLILFESPAFLQEDKVKQLQDISCSWDNQSILVQQRSFTWVVKRNGLLLVAIGDNIQECRRRINHEAGVYSIGSVVLFSIAPGLAANARLTLFDNNWSPGSTCFR